MPRNLPKAPVPSPWISKAGVKRVTVKKQARKGRQKKEQELLPPLPESSRTYNWKTLFDKYVWRFLLPEIRDWMG